MKHRLPLFLIFCFYVSLIATQENDHDHMNNVTTNNSTTNNSTSTFNTSSKKKAPFKKELLFGGLNDDYFSLYFEGRLNAYFNDLGFTYKFFIFLVYFATETLFSKTLMILLPGTVFSTIILPLSMYFIYIVYLNFGGEWAIGLFILRSIIEFTRIV